MYSSRKESYLTFRNYHVVPINGLQPEDIKKAAGIINRDREKIERNTILNHICKSLGFRGGFATYKQQYQDELLPFFDKHNLQKPVDLVKDTENDKDLKIHLSHRQLADSLFKSGRDIPRRIFIGHNVQLIDLIKLAIPKGLIFVHKTGSLVLGDWVKFEDAYKDETFVIADRDSHCEPYPSLYQLQTPNQSINYLLGLCQQIAIHDNLIGTQLFDIGGGKHKIVSKYYDISEEIIHACNELGQLLNILLIELDKGWIHIIPFNKKLIFLSDGCGNYDFVFQDMRDDDFNHDIYEGYLKRADIPKTESEYDFQRWLYFPSSKHSENRKDSTGESYSGWLEKDIHESEKHFYSKPGNSLNNYPSANRILKQYFIDKGIYSPLGKVCNQGDIPTNFAGAITEINGKRYWISDLVTIKDFFDFFNLSEYREDRSSNNDCLATVNTDGTHLPAAVCWYDAMAYVRWFQDKYRMPVRLLNSDEYSVASAEISASIVDAEIKEKRKWITEKIYDFYSPEGELIKGYPDYMPEEQFQKLIFKYREDKLDFVKTKDGLTFIDSGRFYEWLADKGNIINARQQDILYGTQKMQIRGFASETTGKYKHVKIGFRMICCIQ